MDITQEITKKTRSLTELAGQISGLTVRDAESRTIQHFSLTSPFLIMLESCYESDSTYRFYEISLQHHTSVILNEEERKLSLNRAPHKHDFIEIMFVLSGEVTMQIEHQIILYTAGQCCVMNRNIRHQELLEGNFSVVFFMFENGFLERILNAYYSEQSLLSNTLAPSERNELFRLIQDSQADTRLFDKVYLNYRPAITGQRAFEKITPLFNTVLFEIIDKKPGCSLYIQGAFLRFFQLLTSSGLYLEEKSLAKSESHDQVFAEIAQIMETQYGRCTREELSQKLHYTGEYINRIVKLHTGKTLSEYGQTLLLEEARRLLISTDKNISDIIYTLGLSNRSYFYRIFENAYGVTPLQYRKRNFEK